jgi:hypothetical protein
MRMGATDVKLPAAMLRYTATGASIPNDMNLSPTSRCADFIKSGH